MSDNIIVIGGGVSGITTALCFQLLGYDTTIYAAKTFNKEDKQEASPELASLYPSASIIPHSVYSGQLKDLFLLSQSTFYELRKLIFPGLTLHKHFEVFEFDPGRPSYRNWMLNLQSIDGLDADAVPHRPETVDLYGWVFDCIFADWPLYFPALTRLYEDCGGKIITRKIDRDELDSLPADTIINCAGTGGPSLADDPIEDQLILQGHLLHKPQAPLIQNAKNEIVSYNYTPTASTYADSSGNPCDVYCYPRKDGWVLGGSRQPGKITSNNWSQTETNCSSYEIDGITFPAPIIDLNREILETTFGNSLQYSEELAPTVGHRYIRSRKNGLHLKQETISGKNVYHNYGHGGAGVTLSWGCALHIAQQVTSQEKHTLQSLLLHELKALNISKISIE